MSCLIPLVTRNLSRSTIRNVGNCLEKAITQVSANHRIICQESKIVRKYTIKSSNRAISRAPRCISIQNDRYFHISSACLESQIVKTPPFAESVTEGDARLEKKVGDHVAADEVVMEIETDKTSMPVYSPANGIIEEFFVKNGDTVKAGQNLFRLKVTGEAPSPKAEKPHAAAPSSPPAPKPDLPSHRPTPKPDAGHKPPSVASKPAHPPPPPRSANPTPPPRSAPPKPAHHSSPAKPPRSDPPQKSPPSGAPAPPPKSGATASDPKSDKAVSKILETATIKVPPQDPSKEITGTRTEQRVKMNRMRLKIAERLKEAQNVNAMLTTFNEIDMSYSFDLSTYSVYT